MMKLTSQSFKESEMIPGDFSFGIPDPENHVALGKNFNPHLIWTDAPAGTRSFAIICHDPDVPSRGDDVNQEGRTVPASLPRVDFFHWVLIDLPPTHREIKPGEFSKNITPRGKPGPAAPYGARQGINDYTHWFASDNDMRGDYFGYDGPCPPWNDEIRHRYIFTVFALDVDRLAVEGKFTGKDVRNAIEDLFLLKEENDNINTTILKVLETFTNNTGLPVKIDIQNDVDFDPLVEAQLIRVLTEALTNIKKHAQATEVSFTLIALENGTILMSICDKGIGFDVQATRKKGAYGLSSMKERVESIKGSFEILSEENVGTTIKVFIPNVKTVLQVSNSKKRTTKNRIPFIGAKTSNVMSK